MLESMSQSWVCALMAFNCIFRSAENRLIKEKLARIYIVYRGYLLNLWLWGTRFICLQIESRIEPNRPARDRPLTLSRLYQFNELLWLFGWYWMAVLWREWSGWCVHKKFTNFVRTNKSNTHPPSTARPPKLWSKWKAFYYGNCSKTLSRFTWILSGG